VIAGRLTLDVAGEVRTLAVGDLVTFAGEADVSVHLDAGRKAEVLNLITERGIWRATGEVHEADAEHRQVAGPAIVHACGEVRLEGGGTLDEGDTLDSETEVGFRVVNGRAIVLTLRRP
jgi:environmental stress-induced protein Ves